MVKGCVVIVNFKIIRILKNPSSILSAMIDGSEYQMMRAKFVRVKVTEEHLQITENFPEKRRIERVRIRNQ